MNYHQHRPGLKARAAHIALAMTSAAAVLTFGVTIVTSVPAAAATARDVAQALQLRLPKTPIDALDCDRLGPWCEVVSGDTLFYIDRGARYLFVGRLYDMEERRDVTAARLLELNPDLLAAGAARAAGKVQEQDDGDDSASAPTPDHVDLSALPADGAIHWGNPTGPELVVFSDFHCGYCQRLSGELAKAGIKVEERPISIFGAASRNLSEAVLCAPDPARALHQAYAGEIPSARKTCTAQGLDANEAFAKANGFAGTPVIVRKRDGAVLHGYRDAATLRGFATGQTARAGAAK
jgi:thiol:disulfide interchange protein DsbC